MIVVVDRIFFQDNADLFQIDELTSIGRHAGNSRENGNLNTKYESNHQGDDNYFRSAKMTHRMILTSQERAGRGDLQIQTLQAGGLGAVSRWCSPQRSGGRNHRLATKTRNRPRLGGSTVIRASRAASGALSVLRGNPVVPSRSAWKAGRASTTGYKLPSLRLGFPVGASTEL